MLLARRLDDAIGPARAAVKSGKPMPTRGKWLVLGSEDLELLHEPLHTRNERVSDIKFSPDGRWIVVANADNFMDIYSAPDARHNEFRKVGTLKGHSSFIVHVDWNMASTALQSNCGSHELLYWNLWEAGDPDQQIGARFKPQQQRNSSKMRDEQWATQSCIFGWALRGIWQEDADGTDVNACARSNQGERQLIATADDFGKVKLFRYPCIVPKAFHRPYGSHRHVTNVAFVPTTGGSSRRARRPRGLPVGGHQGALRRPARSQGRRTCCRGAPLGSASVGARGHRSPAPPSIRRRSINARSRRPKACVSMDVASTWQSACPRATSGILCEGRATC